MAAKTEDPHEFCQENEALILETSLKDLRSTLNGGPRLCAPLQTSGSREPATKEAIPRAEPSQTVCSEKPIDSGGMDKPERSTRWTLDEEKSPVSRWGTESLQRGLLVTIVILALLMSFMGGCPFIRGGHADFDLRLIRAAERGDTVEVTRYLASGTDVDSKDIHGITPLIAACLNNHYRTAETLLDNGANPNARDPGGETALMMAALNGNTQLVKLLLYRSADPNIRSKRSMTALSKAQQARQWQVVQILIRAGGRP